MECVGLPPVWMLEAGQRSSVFWDQNGRPYLPPNSRGKQRMPNGRSIEYYIRGCNDPKFIDFLSKCLVWDPRKRMTPVEGLKHPWILEGLPPKVLYYHSKMYDIKMAEIPSHLRKKLEDTLNHS